jgi:hypothetical protein
MTKLTSSLLKTCLFSVFFSVELFLQPKLKMETQSNNNNLCIVFVLIMAQGMQKSIISNG